MKQLTITRNSWTSLNISILVFVCLSLFMQILVALWLVFRSKHNDLLDEDKRDGLIRSNNITTLAVFFIAIFNLYINIAICI